MILVESSRYVWTVFEMLVETSQNSNRVILNDLSRVEKKIINDQNFFIF
jgi:hypothetical protein